MKLTQKKKKNEFFSITQFLIIISVNLFSCCCFLVAKSYPALLWPHELQPTRLLCPWNFPGKSTGVGDHFLLQRIFPTQGSNPHLLHWQVDSLPGNSLIFLLLLFFFFLIIYLAVLDLTCGTWEICCIMWDLLLQRMSIDSPAVMLELSSFSPWASLLHGMWDLGSPTRNGTHVPWLCKADS